MNTPGGEGTPAKALASAPRDGSTASPTNPRQALRTAERNDRRPNGKKCSECERWQPHSEFRIKRRRTIRRSATPIAYRSKVCKDCEHDARRTRKSTKLFERTFNQRRRNHAARWGYSIEQLIEMGWDTARRAMEMQESFEHGYCPLCIERTDGQVKVHFFRESSLGLSDLSIDRIDPTKPPIWPGNIQWVHKTCNQRKHGKDPILHGQHLQAEHELRLKEELDDRAFVLQPVQGELFPDWGQ